jgi:enoyl-CoA hydratase/carnithine racemase
LWISFAIESPPNLQRLDPALQPGLRLTWDDDVALLTLEHPSGIPRLSRKILGALIATLNSLESTTLCTCAVITGSDRAFCAGAELEEIAALTSSETRAFSELGQSAMTRIARFKKPVVAAIRGYCIGGGFDLALACHVRVAAPDASFAHRGASLGLITGWGGTQRLARLSGRASEIFVTGRAIAAEEAAQIRLIRRVVPSRELISAAVQIIRPVTRTSQSQS